MTRRIRERSDFRYCHVLCDLLSLGSADEALFVLRLLEQGALPGILSPASLGHPPHPIIDPISRQTVGHRPFPSLSFANDFYFFQVSFATPGMRTVDVLRWNNGWSVIEIDGRGHDASQDGLRARQIGLPERRLTLGEIVSDSFQLLRSA